MINVIAVCCDGTAVVKTHGLKRVLMQPAGVPIGELLEEHEARAIQKTVKRCNPGGGRFAEVIDYAEAFQRASNC
jgi:hypothetical protein